MSAATMTRTSGYVCKRCGAPSPVGVGYAADGDGAAKASENLTRCGCGYSQLATNDSTEQVQNRPEGDTEMITVYSKPNCMQCQMSYRVLDAKGLVYTVVDVTENDAALEYVRELGYLTAPVIVVSEHDHWGGFRPDEIARVAAGGAGEDETVKA